MATTRSRSAPASNGSGASTKIASKAKGAGDTVATAAQNAKGPLLTAGAAATGLAGGMLIGSRIAAKRRKPGLVVVAGALGKAARELGSATKQAARTTDDIHELREQLDKANRQSPVEVLLNGLTHRRGAHKREA
jgi:hypothetical protein